MCPEAEKKYPRGSFRLHSKNELRRTGVCPPEEKKYPCGNFPSSLEKRASPDGSVSGGRKKKYPSGSFPSSLRKRASPDGSVSGGKLGYAKDYRVGFERSSEHNPLASNPATANMLYFICYIL